MTKNKLTPFKLGIYYILFLAVWILRNLLLRNNGGINVRAFELISSFVKLLVWVVPCVFLLCHYRADVTYSLRELFTNKVQWIKTLPVFGVLLAYDLGASLIFTGHIGISPKFSPDQLISGFLFVGITEEMVFRGWLQNAMLRFMKPVPSILLNAVLFLIIHFPGWIMRGTFLPNLYHLGFISIFALSVLFSLAFIKTKNLLVPIALHMFWDLLTLVIYSG